jgi:cytochrome oxidase assembly protein ShyY1
VYDTVTEGLTGWQFLRTTRWLAYIGAAVVFALLCGGLALWQYDRGRGASADNHLYSTNYAAQTVPLTTALPGLASYHPGQVWRAVSMRGQWDAAHQYYLRNSVRSGETGYEVVTAFRLESGETFLIDRGWVAASADTTEPASRPKPPTGSVDVVARLQASQAKRGEGGVNDHQIESVDLTELGPVVGGSVYSASWGVLVSPRSSAEGLGRVHATPPAEGVGYHYSYMVQWLLFAVIGFFLLWRGAVREFRRLNADDPEEQQREAERVRRRARKAFTDEEIEDESLDGYIPLSRWTGRGAVRLGPASEKPRPALTGTPIPFGDAKPDATPDDAEDRPPSQHGQVLVLGPREPDAPDTEKADAARTGENAADRTHADATDADPADASRTDPRSG